MIARNLCMECIVPTGVAIDDLAVRDLEQLT